MSRVNTTVEKILNPLTPEELRELTRTKAYFESTEKPLDGVWLIHHKKGRNKDGR